MPRQYDACPECKESLQGKRIPQAYIDEGFYSPDAKYYRREIGVEIWGVYDGVLFWQCPDCGFAWARYFGAAVNLNRMSEQYAREHNEARRDPL